VKVLALIYGDEHAWDSLSEEERQEVYARYRAFGENAGSKVVNGEEVAATSAATTVRVRDGETQVTDGPAIELDEPLGGFYVLEVESLDEAAELAAHIPGAASGAVELRAESEEVAP
jgi:hypothetical protein